MIQTDIHRYIPKIMCMEKFSFVQYTYIIVVTTIKYI